MFIQNIDISYFKVKMHSNLPIILKVLKIICKFVWFAVAVMGNPNKYLNLYPVDYLGIYLLLFLKFNQIFF